MDAHACRAFHVRCRALALTPEPRQ
jgi:hypothetical protein